MENLFRTFYSRRSFALTSICWSSRSSAPGSASISPSNSLARFSTPSAKDWTRLVQAASVATARLMVGGGAPSVAATAGPPLCWPPTAPGILCPPVGDNATRKSLLDVVSSMLVHKVVFSQVLKGCA